MCVFAGDAEGVDEPVEDGEFGWVVGAVPAAQGGGEYGSPALTGCAAAHVAECEGCCFACWWLTVRYVDNTDLTDRTYAELRRRYIAGPGLEF